MRNPSRYFRFLLVALGIAADTASRAQDYYVSVSGDDAFPGTLAQPWRHVQYALDQAGPFWTVHVMEGVYNEELTFVSGGTAAGPLTLRNYLNEVAVIDGTGLNADALVTIQDLSHIDVIGLEIRNNVHNDAIGVLVDGPCQGIDLLGLNVHDVHFSADPNAPVNDNTNAQPIIVFGSNMSYALNELTIADCEVHDCRPGFSEGLAINGNVTDFVVENNHVHHISNIGIDLIGHEGTCADPALDQARSGTITGNDVHDCISPYAMCGGIYVDGARDLVIEHNVIYDGMWGIEIGCEHVGKSATNIEVRNNVAYNNLGSALMLGGYDYPNGSGKVEDCLIRHNTFYHNDTQNAFEGELTLAYSENCTIAHNILFADNPNNALFYLDDALPLSPGLTLDHNLWYCPGGAANAEITYHNDAYTDYADYQSGTGQDSNSPFGDPQFANASFPDPDLHIASTSPARNAGDIAFVASLLETDMDTEARVNGTVDIGADEYYSNTALEEYVLAQHWSAYPNPSSGIFALQGPSLPTGSLLKVLDASGRTILAHQLPPTDRVQVDLSVFGPGIYLVRMEGPDLRRTMIRAVVR
ncbi:MAG: right-handed parallel beta-helix repeat-containing protein [Flavobacteriales bacterium]|nr:right-handed parallel beta-helix repeat-containing protein [Flavobacteriales bacterium]